MKAAGGRDWRGWMTAELAYPQAGEVEAALYINYNSVPELAYARQAGEAEGSKKESTIIRT
jgi:hypothetical protein